MHFLARITLQNRADFAKNLSILLKSGISINEALSVLADQSSSSGFKEVVKRVCSRIENGTPLSDALKDEPGMFDPVFVGMVRAGEQSGTLEKNLQFLAEWLTRSADLRREVSAATLYPKLVFGAAVLLGGGLATFILPRLTPLFAGLNVELPVITKILLSLSLFFQRNWLYVLFGLVLIVLLFVLSNRILAIRAFYHTLYINMPFFGSLLKRYQLAMVTRLLSTLLKSGLSINEAVQIVASAATNVHYQRALDAMCTGTERGDSLSASMEKYLKLFPKIVSSIVGVGERSGTLEQSFEYLSDFYIKEVNAQTKKLPTVVEPVLLIFIAGMVGFVALAIILPIYELTGSLSR
jgi:type II secretory pathway component PulF